MRGGATELQHLDAQLAASSDRLRNSVGLDEQETGAVASLVAAEVSSLSVADQAEVRNVSPVPLANRIEELRAFQAWMDLAAGVQGAPEVTRAQVIVQNYVCFLYLKDACFEALCKVTPEASVTWRCCHFLSDGRVRLFRNAVAHANWTYRVDFGGLLFWAWPKPGRPLAQFEVEAPELDFWQALSRGVAYAAYSAIEASWAKEGRG